MVFGFLDDVAALASEDAGGEVKELDDVVVDVTSFGELFV